MMSVEAIHDQQAQPRAFARATGSGASSVHFSSKTPEWPTPQDFFDRCHAEFQFTLDPCSTHENAKCPKHYTLEDDGLAQDWGHERVWMNPPYGREIGRWMRKAYEASQAGALVVCLVPARTDTHWWHEWAMKGEIRYVRGRLKFGGHINSAPFPSALVIMRPPNIRDEPRAKRVGSGPWLGASESSPTQDAEPTPQANDHP